MSKSYIDHLEPHDAGIPEAPADGLSYARRGQDASWQPAATGAGVPEAPNNATLHARRGNDASWQPLPPAAQDLPPGGVVNQVLAKASGLDRDVAWSNSFVPAGGAAGEVLTKVTAAPHNTVWRPPIPAAGTTGQILAKRTNADFDAQWITTGARETFRATGPVVCLGTEAVDDVIGTLTILPADLPNEPFYWVCEGQGLGHIFAHNIGATGTEGAGARLGQILQAGTWISVASINPTATFIGPVLRLLRGGSQTEATRIFHYDPTIDTGGIQCRYVVGSGGALPGACTYTFGIEGEIIQYG